MLAPKIYTVYNSKKKVWAVVMIFISLSFGLGFFLRNRVFTHDLLIWDPQRLPKRLGKFTSHIVQKPPNQKKK